ncbi:hypothetical protein BDB01DRAFT_833716 [Pilobolus umbonatus]|nr:hypothetical protein BDB01DRAFT_833716 [Pilobolus umbonatus]
MAIKEIKHIAVISTLLLFSSSTSCVTSFVYVHRSHNLSTLICRSPRELLCSWLGFSGQRNHHYGSEDVGCSWKTFRVKETMFKLILESRDWGYLCLRLLVGNSCDEKHGLKTKTGIKIDPIQIEILQYYAYKFTALSLDCQLISSA